jgi:type I restriction enzyme, S subunit
MVDDDKIAFAQRVILFKGDHERMTNEYLCLFFQSTAGKGELWSRATGSTAIGIKASNLKGVPVIVPPLSEQEAIADDVYRTSSRIIAIIDPLRDGIARLQEYRTALISAAVTGQIDVRGEV